MAESLEGERRPLLSSTTADHPPADHSMPPSTDHTVENTGCCCRLKSCFCLEPILIIFVLTLYPMSVVSSLYTLDWFAANSPDPFIGQNTSHGTPNASISQCHGNTSDDGDQQFAQSMASQFALYESLLDGIPSFFVTILLALGSDRWGRRFAIIPPMVGAFVKLSIFTTVVLTNSSVYWFLLGDFIGGCSGSFHSITVACLAYVADRTPSERRMFRMLMIDLCLMIPAVITPILSGAMIVMYGYVYPLIFAVALFALNLIYVVLFFPGNTRLSQDHESTSDESTLARPQRTVSSLFEELWKQIRSMFGIFLSKNSSPKAAGDERRSSWRRLKLNLLLVAFLAKNLDSSEGSVLTLFLMNSPLCWGLGIMGIYNSASTIVSGVGAVVLTPLFKFCSVPDSVIALVSNLTHVAANVYMVFVKNTVMMFLGLSLAMFQPMFTASVRSLLSNQVGEEEQGALFGAVASLQNIVSLIGSAILNPVYSATQSISTAFAFLVSAFVHFIGCIPILVYIVLMRLDSKTTKTRSVSSVHGNTPYQEGGEEEGSMTHA